MAATGPWLTTVRTPPNTTPHVRFDAAIVSLNRQQLGRREVQHRDVVFDGGARRLHVVGHEAEADGLVVEVGRRALGQLDVEHRLEP